MAALDAPLILLAAGRSSRMGAGPPKGLLRFRGTTWLELQLRGFARAGGREAAVVLGFRLEEHLKTLPWLDSARTGWVRREGLRVRAVINPRPELGPFSSLQQGAIFLLEQGARGAFVLPLDVPCPKPEVWGALARSGLAKELVLPELRGQGGHPVLLSRRLLRALLALDPLSPVARLDRVISRLAPKFLERVPVRDPAVRLNLNDRRQWRRYSLGLARGSVL